jgi:hypothetical protein
MWNAEIVEDRTKLFLTKLQGAEGLSNDEISFGVLSAVEDWLDALQGSERRQAVERLFDLAARLHLSEPTELPLADIVAGATQREKWKEEDRNA